MQNVVIMAEPSTRVTWADCQAFVERLRRQLDRLDVLPNGQSFPTEYATELRRLCEVLEQDIERHMNH